MEQTINSDMGVDRGDESRGCQPLAVQGRRIDLEKHAETIPKLYRALFLRSQAQRSPTQAIKAKCQECCGYEDCVDRVGACSSYKCPLWPYRPYQPTEGGAA